MPDTGGPQVQARHWVQGDPAPGTVGSTTEARYRRPFKPGTGTSAPGTMGPLPSGSGATHTGYRMSPHTGYMNFYTSYRGPSDQVQRPLTLGTGTSHPVQGPLHKYREPTSSTVFPHQAQGPHTHIRYRGSHTPGTCAPHTRYRSMYSGQALTKSTPKTEASMLGTDIEIYEGDIQHRTCAFYSSIRNNIVQLQ
jgi:hypothetical protein